ncbi:Probable MFS transporter precursor [hydrothermal vent metagenome]|uniref:Probable MFS transporter n=1 Tax=hydrothermal vent metagenome TaxID=652676 RepID=A0A160TWA2_9ZZZZ
MVTEVPDSLTRHGLRETATLVVILAFVMNLLSRGIGETFAVFLLPIESEMGWSRTTLAGIYAIYMGAHGLAAVVIGWFVDRVGPRVVYTIGLLAYGLAFLLAQFGTEPWHFYLTTGVMAGIAMTAIGMTTATVLITRWYHGPRARQLSPAIGIAYSGMGAGVILWIPITNALIEMLGWRETYRTLGIILCVLAVIVYVLPWSKLQLTPLPMSRFGSVLGGSKDGHLRAALKTKMFWLLFVIMFITAVAMYLVGPQMVAYLVSVGFDSTVASLAFSINGFLTVFGIAGTGWLARYFGMKRVATISYAMSITAVILLACLTVLPVMALLALAILPLGLSQGARGPIVSVQASQAFSGQGLGAIYGAITMGVGLGGMSGAWLSGVFYDVTGGYVLSYSVSVVCALAGVGLFWMMREVPDR